MFKGKERNSGIVALRKLSGFGSNNFLQNYILNIKS